TAWVRRLLQRRRQSGSLAPRPHAGGTPPALDPGRRRRLVALVAEHPDATLAELRDRLHTAAHVSTIHRALARLGLTSKKKPCTPPSAPAPTSAAAGRPSAAGPPASTRRGSCSSTRSGRTRR